MNYKLVISMKQLLILLLIAALNNTVFGQGLTRHGQNSSVPQRLVNSSGTIGKDNLVGKNGQKAASLVLYQNYQGGKIFYFLKPGDPGYDENKTKGLIAAVNLIKTATGGSLLKWSSDETITTGATADGIGAGKTNTATIITSDVNAEAAILVSNYSIISDGVIYNDWYLPSLAEAALVIAVYTKIIQEAITFGIWTSTEISISQAWGYDNGGRSSGTYKNRRFLSAVAVRQF